MRILLISYWFPPDPQVASLRVGGLARHLAASGHDLRILTRPSSAAPQTAPPAAPGTLDPLRRHYRALRQIPDARADWRKPALAHAATLLAGWQPHLILASGPPHTGLLVARDLSRQLQIPFVADLRDPWASDPYSTDPAWRRLLDQWLERQTLRHAAGLVAVSPVVAAQLVKRYDVPVRLVMNGYDPDLLPGPTPRDGGAKLRILYTGTLYEGRRDPTPLFQALATDRSLAAKIQIDFLGPNPGEVLPLATSLGIADAVRVLPRVPHDQALRRAAAADVLLLLQRNHPEDAGNIPAKVFEYLAVRRPILLLGYPNGVVAQMLRDRHAGIVSNTPIDIAHHLRAWTNTLPNGPDTLPESSRAGLSQLTQFAHYETFLRTVSAE
jgi:glycosyltransferase involved in cell wall biosynthesis